MPEFFHLLECGHLAVDKKKYNHSAPCPRCYRLKEIVGKTEGYSYKCYSCRSRGSYGMAMFNCETAMYKHRRKNPSHKCAVLLGLTVVKVSGYGASQTQLELPLDGSPPF